MNTPPTAGTVVVTCSSVASQRNVPVNSNYRIAARSSVKGASGNMHRLHALRGHRRAIEVEGDLCIAPA